jgi:hypothetical protein
VADLVLVRSMRALFVVASLCFASVAIALPSDAVLSQRMVGTWHSFRHDTRYFADGTFLGDPAYNPPTARSGKWRIERGKLIEISPADDEFGTVSTYEILRLDGRLLKIRWIMPDRSHQTIYTLTRVVDQT